MRVLLLVSIIFFFAMSELKSEPGFTGNTEDDFTDILAFDTEPPSFNFFSVNSSSDSDQNDNANDASWLHENKYVKLGYILVLSIISTALLILSVSGMIKTTTFVILCNVGDPKKAEVPAILKLNLVKTPNETVTKA